MDDGAADGQTARAEGWLAGEASGAPRCVLLEPAQAMLAEVWRREVQSRTLGRTRWQAAADSSVVCSWSRGVRQAGGRSPLQKRLLPPHPWTWTFQAGLPLPSVVTAGTRPGEIRGDGRRWGPGMRSPGRSRAGNTVWSGPSRRLPCQAHAAHRGGRSRRSQTPVVPRVWSAVALTAPCAFPPLPQLGGAEGPAGVRSDGLLTK